MNRFFGTIKIYKIRGNAGYYLSTKGRILLIQSEASLKRPGMRKGKG